jgi:hypothetical protein
MAKKVSADRFYSLTEDFVLDLIALYALTEEKMLSLIRRAEKEGWTPEELIQEMERAI